MKWNSLDGGNCFYLTVITLYMVVLVHRYNTNGLLRTLDEKTKKQIRLKQTHMLMVSSVKVTPLLRTIKRLDRCVPQQEGWAGYRRRILVQKPCEKQKTYLITQVPCSITYNSFYYQHSGQSSCGFSGLCMQQFICY